MKHPALRYLAVLWFCLLPSFLLMAQQLKPGLLDAENLKRVVPPSYFFRGQSATVQLRNSAGFSTSDGKLVLAGLVDTAGYASEVAAKYQGFLITEVKLEIEGTELAPGEYGFGFSKDGKFTVMDVGADDLFTVPAQVDEKLVHPVPLKMVAGDDGYHLCAGRKWVHLKAQ
jgi:hypothetical protein